MRETVSIIVDELVEDLYTPCSKETNKAFVIEWYGRDCKPIYLFAQVYDNLKLKVGYEKDIIKEVTLTSLDPREIDKSIRYAVREYFDKH